MENKNTKTGTITITEEGTVSPIEFATIDRVEEITDEAKRLVADALEESKKYADILERQRKRTEARENKMIRSVSVKEIISIALFAISAIILYLCESTYDLEMETKGTVIILAIGSIMLITSCALMIVASIQKSRFYKTEFIITYQSSGEAGLYEFRTMAVTSKEAVKRFLDHCQNDDIIKSVKDASGTDYSDILKSRRFTK